MNHQSHSCGRLKEYFGENAERLLERTIQRSSSADHVPVPVHETVRAGVASLRHLESLEHGGDATSWAYLNPEKERSFVCFEGCMSCGCGCQVS